MSEVVYSKKQIGPLVDKFGINPKTNTVFKDIINMYPESSNYQAWAIRAVFTGNIKFDKLVEINKWASENQTLIKSLEKKNVVAYTSKTDFSQLLSEMEGLSRLKVVHDVIMTFNTEQNRMLKDCIKFKKLNGLTVKNNSNFTKWYKLLNSFSKLIKYKKENAISLCSAAHDIKTIESTLMKSIEDDYTWRKDDFMTYLENNAPNCKVVLDNGNVVIVTVPNFNMSHKLCGGSHTKWCITRHKNYFDQYVVPEDGNRTQYFLFNFNKPENDELAHIGITVKQNQGILYAQSTGNQDIKSGTVANRGKKVDVYDAFDLMGIKLGSLFDFSHAKGFEWDFDDINKFLSKSSEYSVAFSGNNRIIVKCASKKAVQNLIGHTFMNLDNFSDPNRNESVYVLIDLNEKMIDGNSEIMMVFRKDEYTVESISSMYNAYGKNIKDSNYLYSIGLSYNDFIDFSAIDKKVLFHKCIDEGDEKGALDIINHSDDSFDVNYEFNGRIPIFEAARKNMNELFVAIVNNKKFNPSMENMFGETLLTELIYRYANTDNSKNEDEQFHKMIESIITSGNVDLNVQNINLDTAVNIAAENSKCNWICEMLVNMPEVNINAINDFNRSAIGNAIAHSNIDAIKILGKRSDLEVRTADKKLAKEKGFDIDLLLSSVPKSIEGNACKLKASTPSELSKLFKEVFAS